MLLVLRRVLCLGAFYKPHAITKIGTFHRRTFISPNLLRVTHVHKQLKLCDVLPPEGKESFFERLKTEDAQRLTEDMKTLTLIAETEEEIQFTIECVKKYTEAEKSNILKGDRSNFPSGLYILSMFLRNNDVNAALEWFKMEVVTFNLLTKRCVLLMLVMLYDAGRYEEVYSFIPDYNHKFKRMTAPVATVVLASLYKLKTPEALLEMEYLLNDCCGQKVMLSKRAAFYCCLLAYDQDNVELMLEILQLPVFRLNRRDHHMGKSSHVNLKILAYLKQGRILEVVESIKQVLLTKESGTWTYFPEVLDFVDDALKESENKSLYEDYTNYSRSLHDAGFVFPMTMDERIQDHIYYYEFNHMNELNQYTEDEHYKHKYYRSG